MDEIPDKMLDFAAAQFIEICFKFMVLRIMKKVIFLVQ